MTKTSETQDTLVSKNGGIAKGMTGSVQALPNTSCALLPSLPKIQIL